LEPLLKADTVIKLNFIKVLYILSSTPIFIKLEPSLFVDYQINLVYTFTQKTNSRSKKGSEMTPEEIKLELFKNRRNVTQASIARSLIPPVTRVAVNNVIDRKFVSKRIMEAVATALGRDVKYVFPERFANSLRSNQR